jgi:hypothetical protein
MTIADSVLPRIGGLLNHSIANGAIESAIANHAISSSIANRQASSVFNRPI